MKLFVSFCFVLWLSGCSTPRGHWRSYPVDLADLEVKYDLGNLIKPGFAELLWATDGFAVIRVGGQNDSTLMSCVSLDRSFWVVCKAQGCKFYQMVALSLHGDQALAWVRFCNAKVSCVNLRIADWPGMPHEIPRPSLSDWFSNPELLSLDNSQELWEIMLTERQQAGEDEHSKE